MFFFCRFLSPNLGFTGKFLFVITCVCCCFSKQGGFWRKKYLFLFYRYGAHYPGFFLSRRRTPSPFSLAPPQCSSSLFFQLPFWRGCAHLATSTVPLLVNLNSTTVSKSRKCTLRKKIRQQNRIIGTVVEKPFL